MKQLKIYFEDFYPWFNTTDNFITDILRKEYEVVSDPNPEYLFFSVYGFNHLQLKYKDCIKIFYSMENVSPDFNLCDYAISSHHISLEDRYLRYPFYLIAGFEKLNGKIIDTKSLLNRKFCNFVYSNPNDADPFREYFFRELSNYKKVDSGGRYLNNIGGPVVNKLDFIKNYKFTIAFENSSLSGYTTEKIVEPMTVNSMPIYWGNAQINLDFNLNSFIFVRDYSSVEKAIEEIIRLDTDHEAYIQKLSQPWFLGDDYAVWESKLSTFLTHIIDQPLSAAKRTTKYGYVDFYRKRYETVSWAWPFVRKLMKMRNFMIKKLTVK